MMQIWQMVLNFDAHLPQLVTMHATLVYLIIFGVIFLQIGVIPLFFLPSNPFLFVCGAVWAASLLNIWLLITVLMIAAVLGHITGYFLGKTIGQVFFVDYLKWPNQVTLAKTRAFYDQYGEKGFLISPFLPVIRTLAPFLAGLTQMSFVKFIRSAAIGSTIWVSICVVAGYFFGNIPIVKMHLGLITMMGLAIVIILFTLAKVWRQLAKR